jgi:hypothetical protein
MLPLDKRNPPRRKIEEEIMMQALRIGLALCAVLAFASGASAHGIKGNYLEARTCDVYTGPCFANSEFGLTGDQALLAWKVESGSFNGVNLDGMSVVAAIKAGNTLGDEFTNPYPAKAVLIVDSRATESQRTALVAFAKEMGGRLTETVARVESAPIELEVGCCEAKGCARLVAGKLAMIQTRCPNEQDHVCGNEWVYYQPLTKLNKDFIPAVTVNHEFKGTGLGGTWSSPNKRSAFIGTFSK